MTVNNRTILQRDSTRGINMEIPIAESEIHAETIDQYVCVVKEVDLSIRQSLHVSVMFSYLLPM